MSSAEARPTTDGPDGESTDWVRSLTGGGHRSEQSLSTLRGILLQVASAEARRRATPLGWAGPELDDIVHQAVDDALVAILSKLQTFRGDSKFTTWAYKFVIFEVGAKINRHRWHREQVVADDARWERLPDLVGLAPDHQAQTRELSNGIRRAVDRLTPKQRRVFVALTVQGVPMDVLAEQLDTNRNAIYKVMSDARRRIRAALVADGLLEAEVTDST